MLESLTPLLLSRIQFGFIISFHILFPAFTIGLASWLAVLEGCWLKTKNPVYKEVYQHWVKIFAVTFGMGVVTGVVMSYQFGTNWAIFSHKVGNVVGPVIALEVLTAFFLEASFLGIMLFGWNRVSPRLHFISTLLVAIGTLVSSFWILSVNSWMQTPTGFTIAADGIFYPTSWWEIIFNPSFLYRLVHMVLAAFITTGFVVAGVASWYMLKGKNLAHAKVMFGNAMIIVCILPFLQLVSGHEHGVNTLKYQPVKVAAMEGIWTGQKGAALKIFGVPSERTETTDYSLEIPKGASLILTGKMDGKVPGLKDWPKSERPPVVPVFYSFRIMVGIGTLMMLTSLWVMYLLARKKLLNSVLLQRWLVLISPLGFVALLAGWMVTEVGRQPYIVQNLLKTKDAVSAITASQVTISLLVFFVTYSILFSAGLFYILKLIKKGPSVAYSNEYYGSHGLKEVPEIADMFPGFKK